MIPGTLTDALTPAQRHTLEGVMPERRLLPNDALLTAGDPNDTLFVVTRGLLTISLPMSQGALVVGTRGPGSWVGEVTLLEPGAATATVTASEETWVRSLSAQALAGLLTTDPELASRLIRTLSEELARRIRGAAVVLEQPPAERTGFLKSVFGRLLGGAS